MVKSLGVRDQESDQEHLTFRCTVCGLLVHPEVKARTERLGSPKSCDPAEGTRSHESAKKLCELIQNSWMDG